MPNSLNLRSDPIIARWIWLHERLRTGDTVTTWEYRDTHQISLSTVRTDTKYMRLDWGAPLKYDKKRDLWHYTDLSFEPDRLYFSPQEAALFRRVLVAGRADLAEAEQSDLDRLVNRIARRSGRVKPNRFASAEPGARHRMDDGMLWADCEKAITEQIPMEIEYGGLHRDIPTSRVIEPQKIHQQSGEWFLIAYCQLRQALRTFHLGRIRQYRLRDGDFCPRRPVAEIEATIRDGLQMMTEGEQIRVVVLFDSYQARWIKERQFHETQTLTEHPDGSVVLTLQVRGLPAVKRFVMQFGEHAEVLEPAELRESLAESARKIVATYKQSAAESAPKLDIVEMEN